MGVRALRTFTPEEYLLVEGQAEYKSEYFDGEIYAMAGASRNHVHIVGNTFFSLRTQLKGKPCIPYSVDLKVKSLRAFTYPDILVVCGEAKTEANDHVVTNPSLIIEVLSDSTEHTDRGIKFEKYKTIESLKEYLLISQRELKFEVFRRINEGWLTDIQRESIELKSIGCVLRTEDVYENVKFD